MMTELLAPAGSYQTMTAAFSAGADAVYLGGEKFGARAYADNLNTEEMIRAIDYAHLHGKKLYLTVNTMLKEEELYGELYQYLLPYYEAGLDAVIVQDFGVFSFVRRCFPELAVHCSTQMAVTGYQSARMLEKLGASRVVTARELSLEEIREIRDNTSLEIESFVHGALCYCYSGRCLFSSMLGGRSGNRGKCAQPCRLPYQVSEHGRKLNDRNSQFALSPKDMCTIELIPEILNAGVNSFKIEGRMKRPEYTAGVVRIYRRYMDQALEGRFRGVSGEDYQELLDLYNRDGFHKGYYEQRNGRNMMALKNEKLSAKQKHDEKKSRLYEELTREYIDKKDQIPVSMSVTLRKNEPSEIVLEGAGARVVCQGSVVSQAKNQPLTRERVEKQMKKTGATLFAVKNFSTEIEDDIFITMQELNELRRNGLAALEKAITGQFRRRGREFSRWERSTKSTSGKRYISASVETAKQGRAVLETPGVGRIYMAWQGFDASFAAACKEKGKELYLNLPYMTRKQERKVLAELIESACVLQADGFMVHTPEQYAMLRDMGLEQRIVLDESLSCWNREGEYFWENLGREGDTVPLELTLKEIYQRDNKESELVVYGYVNLMISAQCVKKNLDRCTKENAIVTLTDRYKKEFRVVCDCRFCYNRIYNCVPLSLIREMRDLKKLPVRGFRLSFTNEKPTQVSKRLEEFLNAYETGVVPEISYESTKGHFKRGV